MYPCNLWFLRIYIESVHEKFKYTCNQCDYIATTQNNLMLGSWWPHLIWIFKFVFVMNSHYNYCNPRLTSPDTLTQHWPTLRCHDERWYDQAGSTWASVSKHFRSRQELQTWHPPTLRCDQYVPIQDRPLLVGSDIREPRSGPAFKESNQFEHNFYRKRLYQQPWWCFCFFDNSIFIIVTELWKLLSIFYIYLLSSLFKCSVIPTKPSMQYWIEKSVEK